MQSVEGLTSLLRIVEERLFVMKVEIKRMSDRGFLVDVQITMLTLWKIERHLIVRRTVLLHSPCLRIKKKRVMQLVVTNLWWKLLSMALQQKYLLILVP